MLTAVGLSQGMAPLRTLALSLGIKQQGQNFLWFVQEDLLKGVGFLEMSE